MTMRDDQIKHMVERFLQWRLPENFSPDGGISFKRTFNENTPHPMKHEPVGTNLFDATQAESMVRYMLEGVASHAPATAGSATVETQQARYRAIESAPEHKTHVVWRNRVDTWRDEETGAYIAYMPERLTQGKTEESAIEAAKSVLKCSSEWTLAASQGKDWPEADSPAPSAPEEPTTLRKKIELAAQKFPQDEMRPNLAEAHLTVTQSGASATQGAREGVAHEIQAARECIGQWLASNGDDRMIHSRIKLTSHECVELMNIYATPLRSEVERLKAERDKAIYESEQFSQMAHRLRQLAESAERTVSELRAREGKQ